MIEYPQKSPFAGLAGLLIVLLGIVLANASVSVQRRLLESPGLADTCFSLLVGAAGIVIVWRGLKAEEGKASLMGYIGGTLIWIGIFEWTWASFAAWLKIEPLYDNGMPILPPSMLLIQATAPVAIPILILFGVNKDTRCRMFRWVQKILRINSGHMTRGYTPQYSKVTATETIFLIWFVYVCNIAMNDPRIIGYDSPGIIVAALLLLAWSLYLIRKLLAVRGPAAALRYAIPTGYILSIPIDTFALRGLYPSFWIQPFEFPTLIILILLAFSCAVFAFLRADNA